MLRLLVLISMDLSISAERLKLKVRLELEDDARTTPEEPETLTRWETSSEYGQDLSIMRFIRLDQRHFG